MSPQLKVIFCSLFTLISCLFTLPFSLGFGDDRKNTLQDMDIATDGLAPRGNREQHQHQRFPMDPRFANPPAMHQQQQHHQQHPGSAGPRMPSNYRPPFPATSSNQAVQSLGNFIFTRFSDSLIF